ncbi:MAG: hypothetical protein FWF92_08370, partial [Oscillospiraceae bacterium]|nr:hypothetical protein [Oscillospiraceae bacterium]
WGLTGLWHGAAWTFIVWGMYFGVILIMERLFLRGRLEKIPVICHIYTICAFMFGWVIFRAESIPHIGSILSALAGRNGPGNLIELAEKNFVQLPQLIAIIAGIICAMPVSKYLKKFFGDSPVGRVFIDVSSAVALICCIFSLAVDSYNPFIYFIF